MKVLLEHIIYVFAHFQGFIGPPGIAGPPGLEGEKVSDVSLY